MFLKKPIGLRNEILLVKELRLLDDCFAATPLDSNAGFEKV